MVAGLALGMHCRCNRIKNYSYFVEETKNSLQEEATYISCYLERALP